MRDETDKWLTPMVEAAEKRGINFRPFIMAATMPGAEAADPFADWLVKGTAAGLHWRAVDWVRFGRLLRHELGWCETYPPEPSIDAPAP